MGDKEGAREILQEVIQEGDAQQQGDAKALVSGLA
jgi:pilus assembly protein FimV